MISKRNIIPIILSGGSGSRLWPMSRASFPKQYLKCNPQSELSFLQETQNRLKAIQNINEPIIICNFEHRFVVAEQMRELKINDFVILLEPLGRNTAPAITIAALKSIELDDDPTLLVLSSDHEINNVRKFLNVLEISLKFAEMKKLVTFGVVPIHLLLT